MIPAGYEKTKSNSRFYNDSDFDESDDEFEFEFNEVNKNHLKNNDFVNKENNELNNNCYYNENADLILDELKSAIIQKKILLVKDIVETNSLDVNICFQNDWTPLMYAASNGCLDLVEYFIKNGADVFYSDDSFSVIHCVAGCCDLSVNDSDLVKIIQLLISKGVDPNTVDRYYQTPLMYAARVGNLNLIDCLVKLKADINAQDDNSWTALCHACNKGHKKCVQMLLKLNADPTVYTSEYYYPFDIADKAEFTEISALIKRFIRVKKIENKDLVELENVFHDEDETNLDTKNDSDQLLEQFLKSINLKSLIHLFKAKQIKLKDLLILTDDELEELGISDKVNRHIILNEVKKFHVKNWKSSSLIPVRQDSVLDCNEVLSIVSNLSRHSDYMSANVKYVLANLKKIETQNDNTLFIDKYLNSKLIAELKLALSNTYELCAQFQKFSAYVTKNVDSKDLSKNPIDSIEVNKETIKKQKYFKYFLCASGALLSAFSVYKIVKN